MGVIGDDVKMAATVALLLVESGLLVLIAVRGWRRRRELREPVQR